jgi:uncharacterized membrane protein YfcA
MIEPLYTLSGFCVGALVGMTGVGGGSLMTPLLILLFGIHPVTAVGTDLLYAAITKCCGTLVHGYSGTVEWRIVRHLAIGSMPMALLSIGALSYFDLRDGALTKLITDVLGGALLATGLALVLRTSLLARYRALLPQPDARHIAVLTVLFGGVLGVLVSLSSVGAGAIGVTVLTLLYPRLPTARIVGSDIAHAVPLTFVAGLGHWMTGSVDMTVLGSLLLGSLPGIVLGSYAALKIPDRPLRWTLAIILAIVGGKLLI